VSEDSDPPVLKVMDYGKEQYKKAKAEKKNKQSSNKTKEVKFSPSIEKNDYNVKIGQIEKFLKKNMKVKVSLFFKGRQITHQDQGLEVLNQIVSDVAEFGKVDVPIKSGGRSLFLVLAPEN